jgi:hypothetical protein
MHCGKRGDLMNLGRLLTICALIGLASCSSQNPAPESPNNSAPSTPANSAAAEPSSSIIHHDGCTIDIAKACAAFIDQPQFTYNGNQYDWTRFQQSFSRHPNLEIFARYPDGNVVADLECHVDAQNRKINWARILPNPAMNDKSWDYAKSQRWCQEDSPDYGGWTAYWQKANSASN